MSTNSFENNPFFIADAMRWGHRSALREWMLAASVHGRKHFTNPFSACDCGSAKWASPTRPIACAECRKVAA